MYREIVFHIPVVWVVLIAGILVLIGIVVRRERFQRRKEAALRYLKGLKHQLSRDAEESAAAAATARMPKEVLHEIHKDLP